MWTSKASPSLNRNSRRQRPLMSIDQKFRSAPFSLWSPTLCNPPSSASDDAPFSVAIRRRARSASRPEKLDFPCSMNRRVADPLIDRIIAARYYIKRIIESRISEINGIVAKCAGRQCVDWLCSASFAGRPSPAASPGRTDAVARSSLLRRQRWWPGGLGSVLPRSRGEAFPSLRPPPPNPGGGRL
jgi:hypothetical protein